MKEFSQKEWSRISLAHSSGKNDADGKKSLMTDSIYLVGVVPNPPSVPNVSSGTLNLAQPTNPNPPERLTTSSFVQNMICSQNDKVVHPDLCGDPYRSTF